MTFDDVGGRHHAGAAGGGGGGGLVTSFTTFAVSFTVLTTASFLLITLCHKLSRCCANIFKRNNNNNNKSTDNVPAKYRPLSTGKSIPIDTRRGSQLPVPFSPLHTPAEFQIPGMMAWEPVQPALCDDSSISSTDDNGRKRSACSEEFVQPDALSLGRQKMFLSKNAERYRQYSSSMELRGDQLMPELYASNVALCEPSCSLGKVGFTLQYEDNTKRKLVMTMHDICKLRFNKGVENVQSLILSVTLLPEREYVYKTKTLEACEDVKLHDKFSFHSRPRNRDFDSRTIIISIIYIGTNGKEIPYGEARLPLLTHEIYSQVPTDVTVGIKPVTQNEIGDAQIQISYSNEQQQLTLVCKTIHFSNISVFDKLAGIHIKTYLNVPGEKKESKTKKKSISKMIRFNEARYIEFQDPMTFSVPPHQASNCTLKMSIHGKHKTLVKKMCLGKVRIGVDSNDECGKVHWKHVLSAKDIAWIMWHPIYSS